MNVRRLAALMILVAGLVTAGFGIWYRDGLAIVLDAAGFCLGFRLVYGFWPWDDAGWDRQ